MKKFIIGIIIVILVLVLGGFAVYQFSFKPKVEVTPLDAPSTLTEWSLAKKFIPTNINLTPSQLSATSNTNFSDSELTSLFISVVKNDPKLSEYVSGLQVDMQDNNLIDVYVNLKYKNIPVQAHLIFKCMASNGKGILHYQSGNIGFISISKEELFSHARDNDLLQFNKPEGDVILSFPSIKLLNVQDMSSSSNNLNIKFNATMKFWDWLQTNN